MWSIKRTFTRIVRGLMFITLSILFGYKVHASEVNDTTAMLVFLSLVTEMASNEPNLATIFLTSKLKISEAEADQVVAFAQGMINEHRGMEADIVDTICNAPTRMSVQEIFQLQQNQMTEIQAAIDAGIVLLDTNVGNTYTSYQVAGWISQELKSSLTEVNIDPAALAMQVVDMDKFYERICGTESQPLDHNESEEESQ